MFAVKTMEGIIVSIWLPLTQRERERKRERDIERERGERQRESVRKREIGRAHV